MLVIKQHRIYKADLRNNPNLLYIFGDNLDREGLGGQAGEMRGEDNAFGIATKRSISHAYPDDFFFDEQGDVINIIDEEFTRLTDFLESEEGHMFVALVIPSDGIGTGLSRLQETAPKLLDYINEKLEQLSELI